MIYLDNAATTKIDPEVLNEMLPYLKDSYGNPGSLHPMGAEAKKAVDYARKQVADFMGCSPENVIFTSGGTEGNAMVMNHIRRSLQNNNDLKFWFSSTEHDSVFKAGMDMQKQGLRARMCKHIPEGSDVLRWIEEEILEEIPYDRKLPKFLSIMYVNNETGVVNNIYGISGVCEELGIVFHTDCVQAAGNNALEVGSAPGISFATISSHKIHGPKGVGALYVKDRKKFIPMAQGGRSQEFGLRGGTENVAGIVGFGKACEIAERDKQKNNRLIRNLKESFYKELVAKHKEVNEKLRKNGCRTMEPIKLNGGLKELGKVLNVQFPGYDAQTLLLSLWGKDICASAGSACESRNVKPSRVLKQIGLTDEEAESSVRFSFSKFNTLEETSKAVDAIISSLLELREF